MRIAMIGLRGLPATFGGVERHVEEIGARLAARGHEVVVYCRPKYSSPREREGAGWSAGEYRGMQLVQLPTPHGKGIEALAHSGLASVVSAGSRFDIVHYHALGPGLFTPVSRAFSRAAVVQTVHGLDDQRDKWGGMAQRLLRVGRTLSAHVPHEVIVVSQDLARHYREQHARVTTYVPNGVPERLATGPETLAASSLAVEPGGYLLFVGRIVPEKDLGLLLQAFRRLDTEMKLVIVGGSCNTDRYTAEIEALGAADDRVVFAGFRYGEDLAALFAHAAGFVQPSLLEGLPITLLEAVAYGRPVVASDIAPHREVITDPGPGRRIFAAGHVDSLVSALRSTLEEGAAVQAGARALRDDVMTRYDWERSTDLIEEVYARARRQPVSAPSVTVPNQRSASNLAERPPSVAVTTMGERPRLVAGSSS